MAIEGEAGFNKKAIPCTFCKEEDESLRDGTHATYKEGSDKYIVGVTIVSCGNHMGRLTNPKVLDRISDAMAKNIKESMADNKLPTFGDGLYDEEDN